MFTGDLMNWIPSDRIITCGQIWNAWSKDEIMLRKPAVELWNKFGFQPVFLFCTIFQINKNLYYGNCKAYVIDDTITDEKDDGLMLQIPAHVLKYQIENKVGDKSIALVVGTLSRKQAQDWKTKTKKWKKVTVKGSNGAQHEKSVQIYEKPFISVSCIIPIVTRLSAADKVIPKIEIGPIESEDKITIRQETFSDDEIKKNRKELDAYKPKATEEVEEIEEDGEDSKPVVKETKPVVEPKKSNTNDEPVEEVDDDEPSSVTETKIVKPAEVPEEVENLDNISEVTSKSQKGSKKKRFADVE
jgi:hypothetical protein